MKRHAVAIVIRDMFLNSKSSLCRYGGMTKHGDVELTEQGVMTLSGHKTPQAVRLYVKRTERQRIGAARKRGKRQNRTSDGKSERPEVQGLSR